MSGAARDWKSRPEGGGFLAMWLLIRIAKGFGRRVARPLLWPITGYFLLKRAPERRASAAYLARVLGRPATLRERARHLHTFASTILDRVFLLAGDLDRFAVTVSGLDALHRLLDQRRGVLLFGSHLGSFDVLRVLATKRPDYVIRVVLDKGQSPSLMKLLDALNPEIAAGVIDAAQDGPSVAMAMKSALDEGALVAMLVDRARPDEPALAAPFLGDPARFPTTPWLAAAALKVPVALGFGLFRGGRRYDLRFEAFADDCVQVPRQARAAALSSLIRRYAARLETMTRDAPYNWFNFYDFWSLEDAPASAELDDAAVQRRTAVRAGGDRRYGRAVAGADAGERG